VRVGIGKLAVVASLLLVASSAGTSDHPGHRASLCGRRQASSQRRRYWHVQVNCKTTLHVCSLGIAHSTQ